MNENNILQSYAMPLKTIPNANEIGIQSLMMELMLYSDEALLPYGPNLVGSG
jgi:hypothetical protein